MWVPTGRARVLNYPGPSSKLLQYVSEVQSTTVALEL